MKTILISACLVGERTRYDSGAFDPDPVVAAWLEQGMLVPFCPEVAGGLPTPRPRAEISSGSGEDVLAGTARVRSEPGEDLSAGFLSGARACLAAAQQNRISLALLKEGSPSCGSSRIADGTFAGRRKQGQGVTAALLQSANIRVFAEQEIGILKALVEASPRAEAELRRLDGVGERMASDLWDLGVTSVRDLQGKDPEELYHKIMKLRGGHIDRCVLYVYRCAVYQAETKDPAEELTKWWNWSDETMARRDRRS
jgi:uncharacterized protein YbbK (DUF523 family)